jgi:hypothetical protein
MSEEQAPQVYQTGDVVNGFVWTGTQWLPYQPPKSSWLNIGTWPAVLIAVALGLSLAAYSIIEVARR